MTTQFLLCLLAGAAAGGFINGLAGFGTALFALGFFLNVMTPLEAVTIVVSLSVLSGLQGVWLVRKAVGENVGRLLGFLLPAIIGIPLGVSLLSILEPGTLKLFIAFFLILYGGYFSLRRALPTIEGPRPAIDAAIGFAGGLLGGAASLSGALPTMWCSMRPWPRAETRAVLQPFNVTVLGLTALMLAWKGAYDRDTLTHILIALPVTLTFAQIGIFTFNRMSDVFFRRLLIWLTLLSGVILALRELT